MLKKRQLKSLVEDTLDVLLDIKLNGRTSSINMRAIKRIHSDWSKLYSKLRKKSEDKVDHSTII